MFNRRKHIGLDSGFNSSPLAQRRTSGGVSVFTNIFQDYGFNNMWAADNLLINGTTTILKDFANEHHLTNPDVPSQPTFNINGSIGSNGVPSLTFSSTSNVEKSISGYRPLDAQGEFVIVFKIISGTNINCFALNGAGARNDIFQRNNVSNQFGMILDALSNPPRTFGYGTSDLLTSNPSIIYSYGARTGGYYMYYNGAIENFSIFAVGSDNGACWLNDFTLNQIVIGQSSNVEWVLSGYRPYTNLTDTANLQNELKTIIGI